MERTDGDSNDGGDGSYGKYSDSSEEDWYNKIDEMQGSDTLSGNAYSNAYKIAAPGSNFSSAHPDAAHIIVYEDAYDLRDALSQEIGDDDCDCDCQWGSSYDDSIWDKGGSVSVVNNVVNGVSSGGSFSVPKRNWGTFFKSNAVTYNKDLYNNSNTGLKNYFNPRGTANLFKRSYIVSDDDWYPVSGGGAAVKYIPPSDYEYDSEEGTARSFLEDVGNYWLYFGDSVSKWQDENPEIMNAIGLAMIVLPGGGSTKLTVVEKDSTIASLEVEEIAARIAQSRINIANGPTRFSLSNNAGLEHVLDRHFSSGKNAGQYKCIVDVGYDMGIVKPSMGGQSTSWIEIYTDPRGNLITAYPTPAP